MMNAVKERADSYDEWASRVSEILEAKLDKKRSESLIWVVGTFLQKCKTSGSVSAV